MFASGPRLLALAAVTLLALWLRTAQLAHRPMHSDEANQAVKFGQLLEDGSYAFDPRDHHGPTLYYAALPIAWLRGEHTLAALDEITVRLVPALAGTASVLLLAMLAGSLGPWAALAAAAFLAVTPPAVYYSRYFIQETLLSTFTLAAILAGTRWWSTGRLAWAVVAGIGAGLALATKVTAPLFLVAAVVAAAAARPAAPLARRRWPAFAVATIAAVGTALLLYSSFGAHPAGIRDALEAYGFGARRAAAGAGHEKPWWYYLSLFGWHHEGGLTVEQVGFSALAVCGFGLAWVSARGKRVDRESENALPRNRLLRGTSVYFLILVIAFSAIPYKTPWHAVHWVPPMAVLAAGAASLVPRRSIAVGLTAVVLLLQLQGSRLVAFTRAADERNPYAYVHSSPDVLKVRALVASAVARHPDQPVRIIGDEYWPIPWYLRGIDHVGYWNAAPDDCDGALVIAEGSQIPVVRSRLHGRHHESLLGLRPGALCIVFTPQP